MKIYAPAKVNLALDVIGQFANGYHNLDMIMAPISLFDEIDIEISDKDEFIGVGMELPSNSTVHKMVEVFRKTFHIHHSYKILVKKNIPAEAGLAGGSADGAGVLEGLLKLENIECPLEKQIFMGKEVGADVPFCIFKKFARVQGIGEIITPIQTDWRFPILIVKPEGGVSTPACFKKWHETIPALVDVDGVAKAIEEKSYSGLIQSMNNALEAPAFELLPVLTTLKDEMMSFGLDRVMMSGSGSSMMGFSQDVDLLYKIKEEMKTKYPFVEVVFVG